MKTTVEFFAVIKLPSVWGRMVAMVVISLKAPGEPP